MQDRRQSSLAVSPAKTNGSKRKNAFAAKWFPKGSIPPYPFDRLLVAGAALFVTVPLVIYAWVAVGANEESQIQLAVEQSKGIVRMIAAQIDVQCEDARVAMRDLAAHPATAADLKTRNINPLRARLNSSFKHVEKALYASAYDSSGKLVAAIHGTDVPKLLPELTRLRPEAGVWFASATARPSETSRSPAILAVAPVRGGDGTVGYVALAFPLPALPIAGALYLADMNGWLMAAISSHQPSRQLKIYRPMQYALRGSNDALLWLDPSEREEVVAGYTNISIPHWGVVLTQPLATVFSPTRFLVQKLSVLLIPVMALAMAWSWTRVRSARQIEELARRLAAQNEGLLAADKARSMFLANASHELRTPLACIQISLSGLIDSNLWMPREQIGEALLTMNREVDQLNSRVRNLLDMTRLESGAASMRMETADLTDIVSSALERVAPLTRGREIRADFPAEPLLLECDQSQIETVVVNLVENSVKYSPDGSVLSLKGWTQNGDVGFSISDDGIGVAEGDEARIFDKFYRSPSSKTIEGSGLGLAICKNIVEAHGGRIAARGLQGSGAEFSFTLPVSGKGI